MMSVSDTTIEAVASSIKKLDTVDDVMQKKLSGIIAILETRVQDLIDRIYVDAAGNIKGPVYTLKQVQKMQYDLIVAFQKEFGDKLGVVVEAQKKAEKIALQYFSTMEMTPLLSVPVQALVTQLRGGTVAGLEALSSATQAEIARELYISIASGTSKKDLRETIKSLLVGQKDKAGRPMAVHAGAFAQDSLMGYSAAINSEYAKEEGLDTFIYFGSLIKTSRDWCRKNAGKTFTRAEIDALNDEPQWQGRARGDVWITRGGYRCRHHWMPVR